MRKRRQVTKIQDQVCSIGYRAQPSKPQPDAKEFYADSWQVKFPRRISYDPNAKPREEPPELPRLFIRGPYAGSIKMDLRGLDIVFSQLAFAYWVPDESFKDLHIHCGDLLIIDPQRPHRVGDVVLVELDLKQVLRRMQKKGGAWFLDPGDGAGLRSIPLSVQRVCGVVLGSLRLYSQFAPVSYSGTEANFYPSESQPIFAHKPAKHRCNSPTPKTRKSGRHHGTKPTSVALLAEKPKPLGAANGKKKNRYSV